MKSKKTFVVEVTQIRKIETLIEGENEKDALNEAKKKYKNGEYKFDTKTIIATQFEMKYE